MQQQQRSVQIFEGYCCSCIALRVLRCATQFGTLFPPPSCVRAAYSGIGQPLTTDNNCVGANDTPMLVVKYKYMKDTCSLTCKPSVRPEYSNPYKFGVLGNWRMNRAYSYYDNRKEIDATTETHIRRDG